MTYKEIMIHSGSTREDVIDIKRKQKLFLHYRRPINDL